MDTYGVKLSGSISDNTGAPLPYVIVYVSETSNGTTANSEGLYSLDLVPGSYEISFRMIGFALIRKQVNLSTEDQVLAVQMTEESISLKEVVIKADAEDPAYAIIRAAQKKRKFYRDQVKTYSANSYVKSTQQLTSYPKKLFGQEINIADMMDTTTKLIYLSESVSELFYKAPEKFKEKMISSKVSGSPRTYSFNQAKSVLISFYENLVSISGLTPRGIVSPISANAFVYYKYRHEGTFYENGVLMNKISVIPKRTSDPVFSGTIYIAEDTWRIYSLDLFITKEQQMEFVDTFRIKQNFIRVNNETWMPFSHQFDYFFSALGFKGNGVVLGIFSDYNLNPGFDNSFFDGQVMKVDESANKRDTSYWKNTRPVPLTENEELDYHKRDSTRVIRESKEYLDSLDRIDNKFSFSSILSGYTWSNSFKNISVEYYSPLQKLFFNTVEGWNTSLVIDYEKDFGRSDRREMRITPTLRYGFSNTHFNSHVNVYYFYNPRKLSSLEVDAGSGVTQINENLPVSEFVNSLYSLLAEKNYMKIYEKEFFKAAHTSELFNGVSLTAGGEYAHRSSLSNSTTYKIHNVDRREYTSNDPLNPSTDLFRFSAHRAFIIMTSIAIKPAQEYIDRPEGKFVIGSIWPLITVSYKKGIELAGSDVDYDFIQLGIQDEMSLGLLGTLKYMVSGGDFLSTKSLFLPDLKHFNGNKTLFSDFRINDFKNLDYYAYSTISPFYELHAEENFGGFFLNKIPLIRKLKLREIAGIHFLHTNQLDKYLEISAGIEKLGIFRAELFTSFTDNKRGPIGFLIGIKTSM